MATKLKLVKANNYRTQKLCVDTNGRSSVAKKFFQSLNLIFIKCILIKFNAVSCMRLAESQSRLLFPNASFKIGFICGNKFDKHTVRNRRRNRYRKFGRNVRCDSQIRRFCQMTNLQSIRNSADSRRVGLQNIECVFLNALVKIGNRIKTFAARTGDVRMKSEFLEILNIRCKKRFFDPDQIEFFQ